MHMTTVQSSKMLSGDNAQCFYQLVVIQVCVFFMYVLFVHFFNIIKFCAFHSFNMYGVAGVKYNIY